MLNIYHQSSKRGGILKISVSSQTKSIQKVFVDFRPDQITYVIIEPVNKFKKWKKKIIKDINP